jgi:hypothetical protein
LRAEIFVHVSGAIYVPEAPVFGDVQRTLDLEKRLFSPNNASHNVAVASRNPIPFAKSRYLITEPFSGQCNE